MYKIIEELQEIKKILVLDLTSGLGTEAYEDKNIQIVLNTSLTEIKLPGRPDWELLSNTNPDDYVGYQNIIARNPAWPSELMIFQDYGNHEGGPVPETLSFDERVLFPGLILGSESVGYYDRSISVIYRCSMERLFLFKICKDPDAPDITRIRQKRPTNIGYSTSDEEPDAKIIISVLFSYNSEEPKWKEIMIPGLTAWDIHKPSWIKWILRTI